LPGTLEILTRQRSHILLVLSNVAPGEDEQAFVTWYNGVCRRAILAQPGVLSASHYVQDDVDLTGGRRPPPPFRYLAIYELSIDGAEQAEAVISAVHTLYRSCVYAAAPATWVYYPIGEQVGLSRPGSGMITVLFANGMPGSDDEFREWCVTRHIRQALNIPVLVSGQCFERARFQRPGAADAGFHIIVLHEQIGSSEALVEAVNSLAPGAMDFPTLDPTRFGEAAYRLLTSERKTFDR
jgi:hypothetical protein